MDTQTQPPDVAPVVVASSQVLGASVVEAPSPAQASMPLLADRSGQVSGTSVDAVPTPAHVSGSGSASSSMTPPIHGVAATVAPPLVGPPQVLGAAVDVAPPLVGPPQVHGAAVAVAPPPTAILPKVSGAADAVSPPPIQVQHVPESGIDIRKTLALLLQNSASADLKADRNFAAIRRNFVRL